MKKGQAAMEFLMTYGWAILVVLAAIGALAYFGVLSPSKFLPSKCTLSPGFDIKDCKASASGFNMALYNGMGVDVKDVTVIINSTAGSGVACNEALPGTAYGLLGNGAILSAVDLGAFCATEFGAADVGDTFDADISVIYTKQGESVSHTNTGKIQIKVEQ